MQVTISERFSVETQLRLCPDAQVANRVTAGDGSSGRTELARKEKVNTVASQCFGALRGGRPQV